MKQEQVEKLLQPRYKLIADYPSNIDDIGTVYEIDLSDGHGIDFEMTCKKYPNLFRELEWWEEREVSKMPLYIIGKHQGRDNYVKVDKWFQGCSYPITTVDGITYYATYSTPITEQDYLTYKHNNQK